eukprot:6643638-Alexandrium_andersonii.AAC.1
MAPDARLPALGAPAQRATHVAHLLGASVVAGLLYACRCTVHSIRNCRAWVPCAHSHISMFVASRSRAKSLRAFVPACLRACVLACLPACLPACLRAC